MHPDEHAAPPSDEAAALTSSDPAAAALAPTDPPADDAPAGQTPDDDPPAGTDAEEPAHAPADEEPAATLATHDHTAAHAAETADGESNAVASEPAVAASEPESEVETHADVQATDVGNAVDAADEPDEPEPVQAEGADEPTGDDAAVVADAEPAPPADKKHWYVVKVQSGRENTIKDAIYRKVKIDGSFDEFFGQVLVPEEKVTELRNGKRVIRARKMYPGYIMAHVEYNDKILYLFRETPGVGDFVGATLTRAPNPMPPKEVERMLETHEANKAIGKPGVAGAVPQKVKLNFDRGDRVRVRDGTFTGMEGEVKEIIEPKDVKETVRVRIELQIFGRPVPVEVEVWQVETV